jgi:hypothetical protein
VRPSTLIKGLVIGGHFSLSSPAGKGDCLAR